VYRRGNYSSNKCFTCCFKSIWKLSCEDYNILFICFPFFLPASSWTKNWISRNYAQSWWLIYFLSLAAFTSRQRRCWLDRLQSQDFLRPSSDLEFLCFICLAWNTVEAIDFWRNGTQHFVEIQILSSTFRIIEYFWKSGSRSLTSGSDSENLSAVLLQCFWGFGLPEPFAGEVLFRCLFPPSHAPFVSCSV